MAGCNAMVAISHAKGCSQQTAMRTSLLAFPSSFLLLVACSADEHVRPALEPPPAGKARFYFYRSLTPYGSTLWTAVSLNNRRVGYVAPGMVFYRDAEPGTYEIEVQSDKLYPNQFKTVSVGPASTTFVNIQELPFWGQSAWNWQGTTFVVTIVDPAIGSREISKLRPGPD